MKAVLTGLGILALSACVASEGPRSPQPMPPGAATCPLYDAADLKMWINAMPGPSGPTLIAIFKATAPTPGYRFVGEVTQVMESHPPIYTINITPVPPSGMVAQVLTPTEVRVDVPIHSAEARSVTLTCGGQALFTVENVETAY